jgi:hypothetical protein
VRVEIVPEPEPREREVLLRALGELGDTLIAPPAYRSPWRLAALEPPDEGYWDVTTRRRSSPGAARA